MPLQCLREASIMSPPPFSLPLCPSPLNSLHCSHLPSLTSLQTSHTVLTCPVSLSPCSLLSLTTSKGQLIRRQPDSSKELARPTPEGQVATPWPSVPCPSLLAAVRPPHHSRLTNLPGQLFASSGAAPCLSVSAAPLAPSTGPGTWRVPINISGLNQYLSHHCNEAAEITVKLLWHFPWSNIDWSR